MCEGASKQTPDLKILPPPPRFEIPGSATAIKNHTHQYQQDTFTTPNHKIALKGGYSKVLR